MEDRTAHVFAAAALAGAHEAGSARSKRPRLDSLRWLLRCPRALLITAAALAAYGLDAYRRRAGRRGGRGFGDHLTSYLVRMGPLYVKLGQVLATRSDLLPAEVITPLRQLHDNCPPSPEPYVRRMLADIYGRSMSEVFAEFDFEPLASGSIAQVHKGALKSGEKVAVKLIKRGVRTALADDLRLVRALVRLLHPLWAPLRRLNLPRHFEEIAVLLSDQADLGLERKHQEVLRERFSNHPFVRVPATYAQLSSADVLVMDLVEAIPGGDWSRVEIEPALLARRLQHVIYTMLYHKGVFHADPHPGNVFFTPDGQVILVDFGIVGHISEDEKWGLSSFFYACVRKDWERAVDRFLRYFVELCPADGKAHAEMRAEFAAVLRQHFEERSRRWSTLGFVNDGRRVLQRHGARLTSNFTQVAFMFLTGEGFVTQVHPEIDIWQNARVFTDKASPYMSEELTARFDRELWGAHPTSRRLRARAARSLVAPTHLDRYVLPSRYPLFIRKAEGSRLEDVDGNTLIDLSCGYGPHILGYAHPVVTRAIASAAAQGSINALAHESEVLLAEDIVAALPAAERAVLCNSGTEAVIQAVRLCRTSRGRERVAKFEGHYHGFSDQGLVSSWFRFSGPVQEPRPIAPPGVTAATVQNTLVLQYGFAASLEALRARAHELACVVCEPMPASLASYDPSFLHQLRACCDEVGVPLIFDEVVSGFRVAYGGVQARVGVAPDLTCLGKIIGGGLPCGAVAGRADLIEVAKSSDDPFVDYETKTFVGGTMSGNAIVCAAGHAVLAHLREHPEIYRDLEEKTAWLIERINRVAADRGVSFFVGGTCSIFSMRFADSSAAHTVREHQLGSHFKANLALAYYMRQHNVYVPELHTMMLSAAHTYDDLEEVAAAFDASLGEMIRDGFFVF